jgi:hypothetical protein
MPDPTKCAVCDGTENHVAEMTDGRGWVSLCDNCRPMVVTFFYVYQDMRKAVRETRQAKLGAGR